MFACNFISVSAATLFRNARELVRAAQVYETMSELQKSQGGIFYAAKSLEQAALLYKEKGSFEKVPGLFKNAAQFYRENGSVDTASNCLERGAKILEAHIPNEAAELYKLASDTNEVRKWRDLNSLFKHEFISVTIYEDNVFLTFSQTWFSSNP